MRLGLIVRSLGLALGAAALLQLPEHGRTVGLGIGRGRGGRAPGGLLGELLEQIGRALAGSGVTLGHTGGLFAPLRLRRRGLGGSVIPAAVHRGLGRARADRAALSLGRGVGGRAALLG